MVFSKSFLVFHGCPLESYLKFRYSYDMNSISNAIMWGGYVGGNTHFEVSYSTLYYQFFDINNTLLVSSSLTMTTDNINAIGYVLDPSGSCQDFQYSPTDTWLNSQSVMVFLNAAKDGKSAYIGTDYQGYVPPTPGSSLQITSPTAFYFPEIEIKFCNSTCASASTGEVNIPLGSALFYMNYIYNISISTSYVTYEGTGSTSIDWGNDDCFLCFDDDFGVTLSTGAIVGIVFGCVGGLCILCGCGYLLYRFLYRYCGKKDSEKLELNAVNNK